MTIDDILKLPMVERVARAIRDSECGTGSTEPWEPFADDAYAAIRAMREPSEEILKEGWKYAVSSDGWPEQLKDAWEAMIDKATTLDP